jgi:DNA invertase Pin-like site-specific DNA recombinase
MGIDTGAPMGKAMAHIAVVFAELERDLIRMRTYPRGALQVKEENGVMLGRSRSTPPKRSVVLQVSNVLG